MTKNAMNAVRSVCRLMLCSILSYIRIFEKKTFQTFMFLAVGMI